MVWGRGTAALVIRDDIRSEELRRQARRERDGRVSARLIAIANALDGMDRASAARLAGMDRQTLRDWVHRYNAEGLAGLCDRPKPGRPPKLSEGQMASLKAIVLAGPDPSKHQVGRWRIVDLCRYVEERWAVSYSETGMLRLLWSLDMSHRKTRPRHPQSDEDGGNQVPGGQSRWVGAWGPGGCWIRYGPNWVYRSPPPDVAICTVGKRAGRTLGMARRLGSRRHLGAPRSELGLPLVVADSWHHPLFKGRPMLRKAARPPPAPSPLRNRSGGKSKLPEAHRFRSLARRPGSRSFDRSCARLNRGRNT